MFSPGDSIDNYVFDVMRTPEVPRKSGLLSPELMEEQYPIIYKLMTERGLVYCSTSHASGAGVMVKVLERSRVNESEISEMSEIS